MERKVLSTIGAILQRMSFTTGSANQSLNVNVTNTAPVTATQAGAWTMYQHSNTNIAAAQIHVETVYAFQTGLRNRFVKTP
jgi:hypothetical protein